MSRMPTALLSAVLLASAVVLSPVAAQPGASEWVDLEMVTRIRQEGLHRSQVMNYLTHLTDNIGPRLTGSPGMDAANAWTRDTLTEIGLENARLEGFDFGRGWSFDYVSVHMVAPRAMPLVAYPRAWTPGTEGSVVGQVVRIKLEKEEDFEAHRGQLEGKIVLLSDARAIPDRMEPRMQRHDEASLGEIAQFPVPAERRPGARAAFFAQYQFREKLNAFLAEEGVAATITISSWDYGIVRLGSAASHRDGANAGVPALQMSVEHYNLLSRLVADGQEVQVRIHVRAQFHEDDTQAYNTIAEIPGRGRTAREIVMAGAHLDSWHAGQGATDNATGVAVVMEAVRILKALGVQPRRTIRVAMWSAEEQGLIGSYAYAEQHLATRPAPTGEAQLAMPAFFRDPTFPIAPLPGHARHVAYFNFDNGGGRIRGIHAEENSALAPVFRAWLAPLNDLGADTVTMSGTGGTDHLPFDRLGVPGFQFIQDRLDYFTRTHHSHLDTREYVRREDLMQASVVMATFLYHAAMREEPLPRKPIPES